MGNLYDVRLLFLTKIFLLLILKGILQTAALTFSYVNSSSIRGFLFIMIVELKIVNNSVISLDGVTFEHKEFCFNDDFNNGLYLELLYGINDRGLINCLRVFIAVNFRLG